LEKEDLQKGITTVTRKIMTEYESVI